MKRYGHVIKVRPEKLEEYRKLHKDVWSSVLEMIAECNIRNYSIFYYSGLLFSYYEYIGSDYAADMKKMAEDPETQKWWKLTDPCQQPVESAREGEWWVEMEELFHSP